MALFEYPELALTQIALVVISANWMLRRNDEIPLLLSCLLLYVSSYRYWAVTHGFNYWLNLSNYGLAPVTEESATDALNYIVLGQICTLTTYMWRQKQTIPIITKWGTGPNPFFDWLRPKAIWFGLVCFPLIIVARNNIQAQTAEGRSLAFEVSGYLQQFPMVLIGIATLLLCLWQLGGMTSLRDKFVTILILVGVSNFTFSTSGRFLFLGWLATAGIVLSSSYKPKARLTILVMVAALGVSIFAVAGALRGTVEEGALNQAAWERFFSAEDANMLDGFALLKAAFPDTVSFRWGMAHLEILLRPIPRAIWPDKPVGGGYLMEAGLVDPSTGATLGFSPTFYGDFYSEAGLFGVLLFASLYGAVLGTIVKRSAGIHPFAGVLIRAILCSALVPLLRGGDLPGIYAWIGMAFWPCFLLLWLKRKAFKRWSNSFLLDHSIH